MTELTYHGEGFHEVEHQGSGGSARLFLDPVFARTRRGRRSRGETRGCDFLLVTSLGPAFEDALDALEDHEASTLVGSMAACREARRELRIPRDRTLDLEDWERAGDGDVHITAIPLVQPTPATSGLAFMENIGDAAFAEVSRAFARSPLAQMPMRGIRELSRLPQMMGGAFGNPVVGEPALGFLLDLGGTNVAFLGQGIHDGTDERDLEDLAAAGPIDVAVVEAVGSIGALVRAVRLLEPKQLFVYRGHDPYARGRRALTLRGGDVPLTAYVDAVLEDQGKEVAAKVLRAGDRVTLRGSSAATTEARPS
jgi:hypothetical protein